MTGYVDIQLNGYHGVDFNRNDLTAEQFHFACEKLRAQGVRAFLPTIITASQADVCTRLANLARIVAADPLAREMAPGFHAEGPFINETAGFRGAHPAQHARPATLEEARQQVEAGGGLLRLVTLAPERDAAYATTRWLAAQGIRVAAGHCDPSLDQLKGVADAGLSLYTHLGNGMPMQVHRHDNVIQRALSLRDRITPCFIADGVHIPLFALRNYIDLVGADRAVVVTDGVDVAGLGPGRFTTLQGETVVVGEELAVWSADRTHLCGSASTMPQLEANLRQMGFGDREIRQMLCENPARAAGLKL
ncbi:MAG: N-acetylglucosamine-6-phosphate deacetylase [bacterium]